AQPLDRRYGLFRLIQFTTTAQSAVAGGSATTQRWTGRPAGPGADPWAGARSRPTVSFPTWRWSWPMSRPWVAGSADRIAAATVAGRPAIRSWPAHTPGSSSAGGRTGGAGSRWRWAIDADACIGATLAPRPCDLQWGLPSSGGLSTGRRPIGRSAGRLMAG